MAYLPKIALLLTGLVAAMPSLAEPQACGAGSQKSGKEYAVTGTNIFLLDGPKNGAPKRINEKATAALKSKQYLTIDNEFTVTEVCSQDGWSFIRAKEPDWLRDSHTGWVPSSVLRGRSTGTDGKTEFTEADFTWDKHTTPYKKTIIAGVNRMHRDHPGCRDISPATATLSSSKGTKRDPAFYVTCGKGAGVFNAFFTKSQVDSGATLSPGKHIDRTRAVELCENYARAHAMNPSTVDFSRILSLAAMDHPNGRTTIQTTFTAKNKVNFEQKFNITCLLDSSGLLEGSINEARK